MHYFEEADEIDKRNWLFNTIYSIVQPQSYNKWKTKKDFIREEEGVDQVIYRGEDDWEDIMEEFKAFGMTNIDIHGEGLTK